MPTERKPDQVDGREPSPGDQDKAGVKAKIVNFRKTSRDEQEKKVTRCVQQCTWVALWGTAKRSLWKEYAHSPCVYVWRERETKKKSWRSNGVSALSLFTARHYGQTF